MHERPDRTGDLLLLGSEQRSVAGTPAIRLLAAILEDACFCLEPASLVSRDTRADALAWVRGEVASAAFCSFHEVCDVLGLDVQAVRAALLARADSRASGQRSSRATAA